MPIEINGLINHNLSSEVAPVPVSHYDIEAITKLAKVQEAAGYDRVLIANAATMPDNFTTAAYVGAVTERLGVMLAHRPGFIAPTMAARMLATLDRLLGGRLGVHVITGASDIEMQADGDFQTKEARYHRSREYIEILRRIWTSEIPVDHAGEWYRFNGGFAEIKPLNGTIPIFFGGMSPVAIATGAACADVFATLSDTVEGMKDVVSKVTAAAAPLGRKPDFLVSLRVVVGESEDAAWSQASDLKARIAALEGKAVKNTIAASASGFARTAELAGRGERLEKCFWNGVNEIRGAHSNSGTLVGDPDQLSDAIMDYWDAGVHKFILRGYDPIADAETIGRDIIPALRRKVAEREALVEAV
jgi:alkanesulfonate monooxygenase